MDDDEYDECREWLGPIHIYPLGEGHSMDAFCWCLPDLVIPCECDTYSPAARSSPPNPHCVMCIGTGYVPASCETCTMVIHYGKDSKDSDHEKHSG